MTLRPEHNLNRFISILGLIGNGRTIPVGNWGGKIGLLVLRGGKRRFQISGARFKLFFFLLSGIDSSI